MSKLKVILQTDYAGAKTGFGRNAKSILTHLYKTNKYDLINYCCGMPWETPEYNRFPWKSYGALPNNKAEIDQINKDPHLARAASYGAYNIDNLMRRERPDVWIGVNDIWGVSGYWDRKWFDKITSCIWTTLDSLPILPMAVDAAAKCKNFWVWSNFAEKALHELGHKHVQTVHGALEHDKFFRLSDSEKKNLRMKHGIVEEAFVIGDVFRNQLRKSVPNLLEGYSIWKDKYKPSRKTYLLLHTNFSEGWGIHKLAKQYNVDLNDILCTYICRNCNEYQIKPFTGQDQKCPSCGDQKGQITVNVQCGVTEEQLNEIYNLMDIFLHTFSSGGMEIPLLESKFAEVLVAATNYSCGEEVCEKEAQTLPLKWDKYTEHATEFIKASTDPRDIALKLSEAYSLVGSPKGRQMTKEARQWATQGYETKVIGKKLEDFLDSCPKTTYDFNFEEKLKNPNYIPSNNENDRDWLKELYLNILNLDVQDGDEGLKYWESILEKSK